MVFCGVTDRPWGPPEFPAVGSLQSSPVLLCVLEVVSCARLKIFSFSELCFRRLVSVLMLMLMLVLVLVLLLLLVLDAWEGGTSEAAPEAVKQAVGAGFQSGWGPLLSVTNAIETGTCVGGPPVPLVMHHCLGWCSCRWWQCDCWRAACVDVLLVEQAEADGHGGCTKVRKVLQAMAYKYRAHGGICIYPKSKIDNRVCAQELCRAADRSHLHEMAFYGNFNHMSAAWFQELAAWLGRPLEAGPLPPVDADEEPEKVLDELQEVVHDEYESVVAPGAEQ